MKKLLLFAVVAGLGLVSASPPNKGPEPAPREARASYPPCSRTVTDRCNQLRGHRGHREHHAHRGHREHHAHRGHGGHGHHARGAHRGHAAAAHRPARPLVRAARASRQVAHRVRRAGERG